MKKFLYVFLITGLGVMLNSCGSNSSQNSTSESTIVNVCEECGITYSYSEGQPYEYCNTLCRSCSHERWEDEWYYNEMKKARNKWVDNNPNEAARRGITKIY